MPRSSLNLDVLHDFIPLNALSPKRLREVLTGCRIQSLPAGSVLFRYGDCDERCIFLLSGEVDLCDHDQRHTLLRATDPMANQAMAAAQPRQYTAIATTTINVLAVSQRRLYDALLWEQSLSTVAQALFAKLPPDTDRDWILRLLQSRVFYRVPPMNILELLQAMQPQPVLKDQLIIREGEQADCCYFIREGRAEVRQHDDAEELVLAYLGKGQYFGEEGLLQEGVRNADVRMLEDGLLMRLEKRDFDRLLKAPSLDAISFALACSLVEQQEAAWLDVRLPEEYKQAHLRGAQLLPLRDIRLRAAQLPLGKHYIIYCDNGQRSAAAAFLLGVQGLNASVLTGGIWTLSAAERQRYLEMA